MLPNLYLYIDNFSFSDYYSSNSISCEAFMPNKKGSRTIARNTQNFLFLTHKKINANSRLDGISDQLTSWPITLEFCFDIEQFDCFPVVFVKGNLEDYSLECGDLSEYDPALHLGCYVFGELPFSTVTKILFDDECQLADSDKSIFPDFLWRADIVDILKPNEFSESFFDLKITDEDLFNKMNVETSSDVMVSNANKYRAAILQLVNGTKSWRTGKYQTSFDSVLQQFFSIETYKVKEILSAKQMPVKDETFQDSSESITLIPTFFEEGTSSEQNIYNIIVRTFLTNKEKCTPAVIHSLLENIKTEFANISNEAFSAKFAKTLDAIESCSLNMIGFTADSVLRNIADNFSEKSILKALFFVIKNSTEYEKFVLSLSLYKADAITARRAMILWSFLNGIRGIPAQGYNRENMQLWANVEWKYAQLVDSACKMKKPVNCADTPCGIEIISEEIITFEEVQSFLIENKLTNGFLKEIYTIAKNLDRTLSKVDPYCGYVLTDENFYSKLPRLSVASRGLITKSEIDAFDKAYNKKYKELIAAIKKNPLLDYEAIYRDWVVCTPNFKKIWNVIEDRLKAFYLKQRG